MKDILLLDGSSRLTETVEVVLKMKGFHAKGISNEQDFFTAVRELKPGLVLIDVQRGHNYDGIAISNKLKSDPQSFNIAVILCTSTPIPEDDFQFSKADSLLEKPFHLQDLLDQINALDNA